MKRKQRFVLVMLISVLLALAMAACNTGGVNEEEPTSFTVSFNVNGGSIVAPIIVDKDSLIAELPTPMREGYTFDGWYKETDLAVAWDISTDTVTEDITLYAKWTEIIGNTETEFTVSFNANGGSIVAPITVDKDSLIAELPTPTREGYTFDGWYKETDLAVAWDISTDTVTEDITLYAKWEVKTEDPSDNDDPGDPNDPVNPILKDCAVSFETNGGGIMEAVIVVEGELLGAPNPEPTKDDYICSGWYKESELINLWDFDTDTVTEDIILYAKWEVIPGTEGLSYALNADSDSYKVTGYTGAATEIRVPAEYNNLPVTAINDAAFKDKTLITAIIMPNSVADILEEAFAGCSGLENITLGANSKLTTIGVRAFSGCKRLIGIELPSLLTGIGAEAFGGCSSLTSIEIPASVTSIGGYAFQECLSLTSIELPALLTSIGDYTFLWCESLENVYISSGITSIGDGAFENCSSLTSIELPASLISIGEAAFLDCESLESIYISDGVISIGDGAFEGCFRLTGIEIPKSVTNIGESAFSGSSGLTSMTLPFVGASRTATGIESLFGYIFGTASYDGGTETWQDAGGVSGVMEDRIYYIPTGLRTVEITGTDRISNGAFMECRNLTSIELPASLTSIGGYAFLWCENLESVYIPNGVISLGLGAFESCISLTSIELPASVTSIGAYAFANCQSLTDIVIPTSVTEIGGSAFFAPIKLISITLPFVGASRTATGRESLFGYVFGNFNFNNGQTATNQIYSGGSVCYYIPSSLRTVVITDTDRISYGAFSDCGNLTSIVLPASLTEIGDYAFLGCYGLTSIEIPISVTSIGASAFSRCNGLTSITLPFVGASRTATGIEGFFGYVFGESRDEGGETWTNQDDGNGSFVCNIPESLHTVEITDTDRISNGAFSACRNLTSILLPSSLTEIGDYAFLGCYGLTSIEIPSSVTSIGINAFLWCENLESVYMPNGVISIGRSAFASCISLTSIELPASVTSIGAYAFWNCNVLENVVFEENSKLTSIGAWAFANCHSLTDIVIPTSVTEIGDSAFFASIKLISITLPFVGASRTATGRDGVFGYVFGTESYYGGTAANQSYNGGSVCYYIPSSLRTVVITDTDRISYGAFSDCGNLMSIELPASLVEIEDYAFLGCSGLTSIEIPSSVTSIGASAFSGCSGLTSITLPFVGASRTATGIDSLFGYIFGTASYDGGTETLQYAEGFIFAKYYIPTGLSTVEITDMDRISFGAFLNCRNLTSIELPASLTSIGDYAFLGCESLESVYIPDGVISLGNSTFDGCRSLTSIELPASLTSIGDNTFALCESLESINIPNGVISLGNSTFYGCRSLTGIELPASLTSIGDYTFLWCESLESVYIPDGVISIGQGAFESCISLTSIEIPASVTSIGTYAFVHTGLTSITLPFIGASRTATGRESLFGYIFGNFNFNNEQTATNQYDGSSYYDYYIPSSLRTVVITDIEKVGYGAFSNCKNLTSIELPLSLTEIGGYAFLGCSGLTSIEIPSSVTSIGEGAFEGCSGLTSIELPSSLTEIGDYAFFGCSGLTSIELPSSLTEIGNYAFWSCSGLTGIEIPSLVSSIGASAFEGCSGLTSIELPASLTSIGDKTFAFCESLESINIPNGVISLGNSTFYGCRSLTGIELPASLTSIGDYTFLWCESLENVYISSGITSIGDGAFENCSSLTSIELPASLISIGDNTFAFCESLTSIELPASLTSIGGYAFLFCESLASIVFGHSVQSIGSFAFAFCTALTSITIPDSVQSIADYTFMNCESLASIVFGHSVQSIGSFAFAFCEGLTSITIPDNVQVIGERSFSDCPILTSITIGIGVTHIYHNAFYNNPSLTSVTVNAEAYPYLGINVFTFTHADLKIYVPNASVLSYRSAWSDQANRIFPMEPEDEYTAGLLFTEIEGGYRVSVGTAREATEILIPRTVLGVPVIEIGSDFRVCANLEKLTIPFVGATLNGTSNTYLGYIFGAWNYMDFGSIPYSLSNVIITGGNSIGDYAFMNCNSLISVTIPDSVTVIGERAFFECWNLTSINIPDSVTSIGEGAFEMCENIQCEIFDGKLKYINNILFGVIDRSVAAVTLKPTTRIIIGKAFEICTNLASINIPVGVTSIGAYAFYECRSLTDISIPDSVTSIGEGAFYGCRSLTNITIEDGNAAYMSIDGVLFSHDGKTLIFCPGGKTGAYTIPVGVTSIGANAFYNCTGLTGISIPNSVTDIGEWAFYGCAGLREMIIPDGVTIISEGMFYMCGGLTSVTFGDDILSIGMYAFNRCVKLMSITIPSGVMIIGDAAFVYCGDLTSVTINRATPPSVGRDVFTFTHADLKIYVPNASVLSYRSAWSDQANKIFPMEPEDEYTAGLLFTEIEGGYRVSVGTAREATEILIPRTVLGVPVIEIDSNGFSDCFNLQKITIPESVQSIGNRAFVFCDALTSVTMNASTPPMLGLDVFELSHPIVFVPDGAVDDYKNDESWFWYSNIICSVDAIDGDFVIADNVLVKYLGSGSNVIIPDSVTSIGSRAFFKCINLTSVTFGNNGRLTRIEDLAFAYCGLTGIEIPSLVTSIGSSAFQGCSGLTSLIFAVNSQLTNIGGGAFEYCVNLAADITIPESVTNIGIGAFAGGSALRSVTMNRVTPPTLGYLPFASYTMFFVPNDAVDAYKGANEWSRYSDGIYSVDTINGDFYIIDNVLIRYLGNGGDVIIPTGVTSIGTRAFFRCGGLTSVEIGADVTSIGEWAFYGCSDLASVTLADNSRLTSIGNSAFRTCGKLTNVTFGANSQLGSIGDYAFDDCDSLTEVTLSESVTSIGDYAFFSCGSLTSVTINRATPPSLGSYVFSGTPVNLKIYVPDTSMDLYQSAWGTYSDKILAIGT